MMMCYDSNEPGSEECRAAGCTCPSEQPHWAPGIFVAEISCPVHGEDVKRMIRLPAGNEIQL